ncbi:cytochrome c-type biogenesis protein CcmH [Candidatus Puniceispirillum marinum]|uniref:Cytochrome c-type biogenesis protein n=1 Tax=Puniceispirillum marinum (strain IMCC1322) TaxID=488538 RepID=D5BRU3_PUNMI|nr:cytochrome c-type biogenesis protein CcmH [Candidatus Puniceispirillum marinum]ADE38990.1 cytochrome C biogenesis protein [Candidatus Puniceispirillum marinum IMCC1322]
MIRQWLAQLRFIKLALIGVLLMGALVMPIGPYQQQALAITAEERLDDPAMEMRARDIGRELRCLVCQNQSIDDSDAELAVDLRKLVRQRLVAGDTDAEVIAFIRERYGDFVLFKPPVSSSTWLLWGAPIIALGLGVLIIFTARRKTKPETKVTASADKTERAQNPDARISGRFDPAIFIMGAGAIALVLGIYAIIGRPDLPDQPLAARQADIAKERDNLKQMRTASIDALQKAQEATAANPDDIANWLDLADKASMLNDYETELFALGMALEIAPNSTPLMAIQAEAMVRAAEGQVTLPVRERLAAILERDPMQPRALFLTGLAAYQDGRKGLALNIWKQLLESLPKDAPVIPMLEAQIAAIKAEM